MKKEGRKEREKEIAPQSFKSFSGKQASIKA